LYAVYHTNTAPGTVEDWAAARFGWWRLPVLLWFLHAAAGHLRDRDGSHWSLLGGLVFGAHEFGHLFFAFFGELLTVFGGSLMQLLVPIGVGALMWRSRDWFGLACAAVLLGASLGHLAVYVADASVRELDLVSFSPDAAGHDWNWLLRRWDLLAQDQAIARLLRALGWLCWGAGAALGGWLLTRMRWRLSDPSAPRG
jgi:hypothetical protein